MYYRIEDKLIPITDENITDWNGIAAILTPEEVKQANLPLTLTPEENFDRSKGNGCRLIIENNRICGEIHIPTHAKSVGFIWKEPNLLLIDPDGIAGECFQKINEMRPHHRDGADDVLMDFILALIMDDMNMIEHMEDQLSQLEQNVLDGKTDHFIHQMSHLRKQLNARNRYYAQLDDMMTTLQENSADLLDTFSSNRLQYVLRRLNHLRSETQMLREYATQISSEYQAQVDLGQNRIMKLLTIVTTVFMPLTLITGWYGMNFINMPELQWEYGYPAIIIVSILVIIGCMSVFRRKHYW